MTPKELKQIRQQLDLTQAQMAKALGLSREHYNPMERGARAITDRTASHARLLANSEKPVYHPEDG